MRASYGVRFWQAGPVTGPAAPPLGRVSQSCRANFLGDNRPELVAQHPRHRVGVPSSSICACRYRDTVLRYNSEALISPSA